MARLLSGALLVKVSTLVWLVCVVTRLALERWSGGVEKGCGFRVSRYVRFTWLTCKPQPYDTRPTSPIGLLSPVNPELMRTTSPTGSTL